VTARLVDLSDGEIDVPDSAGVHLERPLPGENFALPACWVEGRLTPDDVAGWAVSYDHGNLPPVWMVTVRDGQAEVTCPECREWVHA
jgi:hypothetical protein